MRIGPSWWWRGAIAGLVNVMRFAAQSAVCVECQLAYARPLVRCPLCGASL